MNIRLILLSIILFLSCCEKEDKQIKMKLKKSSTIINQKTKVNEKLCSYKQVNIANRGYLKNICKIEYHNKSKSCVNYLLTSRKLSSLPVINQSYVSLWHKSFDSLIWGTSVALYAGYNLSWQDLEKVKLNLDSKQINYHLKAQPFIYEEGRAYANFANRIWGGGVLRGANVQEEIKMRQSNILPWIAEKDALARDYVSWCPSININTLDVSPVVMSLALFLDFDNKKGYGRRLYNLPKQEQKSLLRPKKNSIQIYSFAMAAPYLKKNSLYREDIIKKMVLTATQAFYLTMLAMDNDNRNIEINTGNWGAGAFNHSFKMSWAVQLLSVSLASKLFKEKIHSKQEIKYIYNAFGKKEAGVLSAAFLEINTILRNNLDLDQAIQFLVNLANSDQSWQVMQSSVGEN